MKTALLNRRPGSGSLAGPWPAHARCGTEVAEADAAGASSEVRAPPVNTPAARLPGIGLGESTWTRCRTAATSPEKRRLRRFASPLTVG